MNAKDMFKKLGYEEKNKHNSKVCKKAYINYKKSNVIQFDFDKSIRMGKKEIITMELVQAINQQIKELGWYE